MLTRSFVDFLRDERGSYTLWSLVWFLLYVAMGGLAVDITDAYRYHTQLQATADAAALAGAMSLQSETEDPVQVALEYARVNMSPNIHGPVLKAADVQVGEWHFATEAFYPNSTEPNAVYVTTRRDSENDNQVVMSFLRILQGMGLRPSWDIIAEAVAVVGVNICQNNGLIAGGKLDVRSGNGFYNNICLHGMQGFLHRQNNVFEPGVTASVTCSEDEKKCIGPSDQVFFSDEDFNEAWELGGGYEVGLAPSNAYQTQLYVDAVIQMAQGTYTSFSDFETAMKSDPEFPSGVDLSGLEYLTVGGMPEYVPIDGTTLSSDMLENSQPTVYHVKCGQGEKVDLPDGDYNRIAVITTCPIFDNDMSVTMNNTMIAVDLEYAEGQKQQFGLHMAGNIVLGDGVNCEGGVDIMTTGSSIDFAAGAGVNDARILSGWNIAFAAGANADVGVHMEAVNDIDIRSESNFGLCPNKKRNGPQVLSYSLVR